MKLRNRALFIAGMTALLASLPVTPSGAAVECRGQRATIVGTSGNDELEGTAGRDVIASLGGNDSIFSGGGNDLICTGPGNDEAYAAAGNDVLMGQGGSDTLVGDEGDDRLIAAAGGDYLNGGPGDDLLQGARGFDFADFGASPQAVTVDLAAHQATGDGSDGITGVEMVAASPFDDILVGSNADFELFRPLAGNDSIDGRGGRDQLLFDESPAAVSADVQAGSSTGEGNDTFTAIESLVGSPLGDTLRGHDGSDDIYGYAGNDTIDGRAGNDYILGQAGDDTLLGAEGKYDMVDFLPDSPGVTVDMGGGTATGEGNDQVSGFEIIGGTENNDTLRGASVDELFYPYGGNDVVDGRDGSDLVLYNATTGPISADLATGTAQGEGTDSLTAIEGLVGSPAGDTFVGDEGDNLLMGGPGNDVLSGGDGNDYFEGNRGDDQLDGGAGTFDMLNLYAAGGGTRVDLAEGWARGEGTDALGGIEAVFGSSNDDVLSGDKAGNYLSGGEGDDVLAGRGGDDTLDGESGANEIDGGPGTDACVAAQRIVACEGEDSEPRPDAEAAQRAQELAERLAELFGTTK